MNRRPLLSVVTEVLLVVVLNFGPVLFLALVRS